MTKKILGVLASVVLVLATQVSAQSSQAEAAAAYDGTGVKPPQELVLQQGQIIGDIRLPKSTKVDAKKSLMIGSGLSTYGNVLAKVRADTSMVKRFFLDNMPTDGWELISEFESNDITLVFQKPTRVAVVMLERAKRDMNIRIILTPRS